VGFLKGCIIWFIYKNPDTQHYIANILKDFLGTIIYVHVKADNIDYNLKLRIAEKHNETRDCKHMVDGFDDAAALYLVNKLLDMNIYTILLTNDRMSDHHLIKECCPKFTMTFSSRDFMNKPITFDPSEDIILDTQIEMKTIVNYRRFDLDIFKNVCTIWTNIYLVNEIYIEHLSKQKQIPNKDNFVRILKKFNLKYKLLNNICNIHTIHNELDTNLKIVSIYLLDKYEKQCLSEFGYITQIKEIKNIMGTINFVMDGSNPINIIPYFNRNKIISTIDAINKHYHINNKEAIYIRDITDITIIPFNRFKTNLLIDDILSLYKKSRPVT
jgi:hypothetical protein